MLGDIKVILKLYTTRIMRNQREKQYFVAYMVAAHRLHYLYLAVLESALPTMATG
jgi:hypothetical protein